MVLLPGGVLGYLAGILLEGRLVEHMLTRPDQTQPLSCLFFDDAGVGLLQAFNLSLQLLMLRVGCINLFLQPFHLCPLALPYPHAVGADYGFVPDKHGQQADADGGQHPSHGEKPTSGNADGKHS